MFQIKDAIIAHFRGYDFDFKRAELHLSQERKVQPDGKFDRKDVDRFVRDACGGEADNHEFVVKRFMALDTNKDNFIDEFEYKAASKNSTK